MQLTVRRSLAFWTVPHDSFAAVNFQEGRKGTFVVGGNGSFPKSGIPV